MSKVDELKDRLIKMIDEGCTGWHISPGPKWHSMSIEDKAAAILQMWDAKGERVADVDGPPRTNKHRRHVSDIIAELEAATDAA